MSSVDAGRLTVTAPLKSVKLVPHTVMQSTGAAPCRVAWRFTIMKVWPPSAAMRLVLADRLGRSAARTKAAAIYAYISISFIHWGVSFTTCVRVGVQYLVLNEPVVRTRQMAIAEAVGDTHSVVVCRSVITFLTAAGSDQRSVFKTDRQTDRHRYGKAISQRQVRISAAATGQLVKRQRTNLSSAAILSLCLVCNNNTYNQCVETKHTLLTTINAIHTRLHFVQFNFFVSPYSLNVCDNNGLS